MVRKKQRIQQNKTMEEKKAQLSQPEAISQVPQG